MWIGCGQAAGPADYHVPLTGPKASRDILGALLVGYFDEKSELRTSPFSATGAPREKGAHWVTPTLVAQIGYREWTHDAKLRHPRFLGLREDKSAREVRRTG